MCDLVYAQRPLFLQGARFLLNVQILCFENQKTISQLATLFYWYWF